MGWGLNYPFKSKNFKNMKCYLFCEVLHISPNNVSHFNALHSISKNTILSHNDSLKADLLKICIREMSSIHLIFKSPVNGKTGELKVLLYL